MKQVSIVFLFFFIIGCSQEKQPPQQQPPMTIPIAKPLLKKIIEWDEYTGRFQAVSRVEVRARVSGYVDEIKFKDGQMVKKGDVLFVIDKRPFQLQIELANAELQSAIIAWEQAKTEFERIEKLKETLAASKEEYDQRNFALRRAQSTVSAAQASLNIAKLNLEFTEVKAPVSGRLSRDLVNVGNLISGGNSGATLLTTIVTIDPIHFYFEANEAQLLKYVRLNQSGERTGSRDKANPIKVKLMDEEDYVHRGRMDFVDNSVDFETGTIQGRAIFPNKDGLIHPGMFGRAQLIGSGKYEAMLIPDHIISTDQSNKFIYVVTKENKIERRYITLGPLHQKKLRIVRKGLTKDDQVVVGHIQKVRSGMTVNPTLETIK